MVGVAVVVGVVHNFTAENLGISNISVDSGI